MRSILHDLIALTIGIPMLRKWWKDWRRKQTPTSRMTTIREQNRQDSLAKRDQA